MRTGMGRIGAALVSSLIATTAAGCGSGSGGTEDQPPIGDGNQPQETIERIAADLNAANVDAAPFTKALSDGKSAEDALASVPDAFRQRLTRLRDQAEPATSGAGSAAKPQSLEPQLFGGRGASQRIAVVIIANANPDRWVRNVAEFVGLSYFDVHMRSHYAESHVCSGDNGTWGCFRDGLDNAASAYQQLDVILETHGFFAGNDSTAFDNDNQAFKATDLLKSPNQSKYRFGMFMNCFAARDDKGGFAQIFVANGGRAAYGAREISSPVSDVVFQSRFGTVGVSFGEAVDAANASPLEQLSQAWTRDMYLPFHPSPKVAFGGLDGHIDDLPAQCNAAFLGDGSGASCDDGPSTGAPAKKSGGCAVAQPGGAAAGGFGAMIAAGALTLALRRRRRGRSA